MPTSSSNRRCTRARAWVTALATTVAIVVASHVQTTVAYAQTVVAQVQVNPTSTDFPGGAMVQRLIDWAGQFGLWGSVASLLIGAGIWGVSQQFGNGFQAGKGKILAAAGAVGAVLTGLAPTIVNTLFNAATA
jgi:hypothetical protein